jgi:formylglycine-generating enzyme required for sulfatase activity
MKLNLRTSVLVVALTGLMAGNVSAVITIDSVPVGNSGNANDSTGYGAVGYDFYMGKYEVTLNQYTAFLNAVAAADTYSLYNANMAANLNSAGISRSGVSGSYTYSVIGSGTRPVTFVSWFDAARFVNWVQNGQPTGLQITTTTEDGAYTLLGAVSGVSISKNAGAQFWIPAESEWYKAAYFQPAAQVGPAGSYWLYPTRSSAIPNSRNGSFSDPNSANFKRDDGISNGYNDGYAVSGSTAYSSLQQYLTSVGAFSLANSYYGTFDQGGNVSEWSDAISGTSRIVRGGSWTDAESFLRATTRTGYSPTLETSNLGFRIVIVPEPGVAGLLALGMALLAWKRSRTI